MVLMMIPSIPAAYPVRVSEKKAVKRVWSVGGCPFVAYNSGGLVEIVRKGGGVLVDGGTREFADAVSDLLADDAKRWELGKEGRKVVEENFSVDAMGRKHQAFYEKVLAGTGAA